MKNYAIIRLDKLNSTASIRRSLKHAFRTQDTPTADPARLSDNSHFFAADVASAMQNIKMRWPKKIRKNGVRLVEFLVTGSPEAINAKTRAEQDAYFADALKYIQDKHGVENVVYAGIHRDETTPHMYVYTVPIDEHGKLNCNGFYGKRTSLTDLQTDFAEEVGKPHGLERGEHKSKAKHTSIKTYYTRVNAVENMTISNPGILMPAPAPEDKTNIVEYGKKVAISVVDQLEEQLKNHTVQSSKINAELADKVKYLAKEVEELKLRNDDLQKGLDNYKQAYESQKIITASAKNDIKELKKTLGLFKPHEIELAMGRRKEEEQAELEQAKLEESARIEFEALMAKWWDLQEMQDFYIENVLTTPLTWSDNLMFVKDEIKKWEKAAKKAQEPLPTVEKIEEKPEASESHRDDYESPSPF